MFFSVLPLQYLSLFQECSSALVRREGDLDLEIMELSMEDVAVPPERTEVWRVGKEWRIEN